jgi:asparagine synthase (glutamine-hydrolysing)
MCGINLILDKKNKLDSEPVIRMCKSTTHRGPDHTAFHTFFTGKGQLLFGHNRLSIIDLRKEANQPFISECGRYGLIFNGEVYNYTSLKNEMLRQGINFNTQSDTEVLFWLLQHYGQEAIHQLEGMFAFAFYNHQNRELILARDKHGMKPVYYFENDDYFIASSEIKGILASGLVDKEINVEQIPHYLRYKYTAKPYTFIKHIYELEEGKAISKIIDQNTLINSFITKDNIPRSETPLSETEILGKTEELLTDALYSHLQADVPCGIFLSGGIDSTLLLALAKKSGFDQLSSFSIVNDPKEKSSNSKDTHYSRLAAKQYGRNHYEVTASSKILHELDHFIDRLDQPIGDGASLLTFILSREASKMVKVVLSGAGADEVFGGYNRHWAFYQYLNYYPKINSALPLIKKLGTMAPSSLPGFLNHKLRLGKKLLHDLDSDPIRTFDNFIALATIPLSGKGFSPSIGMRMDEQKLNECLAHALKHDKTHFLISDVLALNDKMSMQSGLEMRMPYLDNHLVDFIGQLPPNQLFSKGRKWILSELLQREGGAVYTQRAKEGFGMPFGKWIREKEFGYLFDFLNDKSSPVFDYLPQSHAKIMYQQHLTKKADYTQELWAVLVLAKWLERQ